VEQMLRLQQGIRYLVPPGPKEISPKGSGELFVDLDEGKVECQSETCPLFLENLRLSRDDAVWGSTKLSFSLLAALRFILW
jgi:hypothetical protein